MQSLSFIGLPVHEGNSEYGTIMGPEALRAAGLLATLEDMGQRVSDLGNWRVPNGVAPKAMNVGKSRNLSKISRWIHQIDSNCIDLAPDTVPIFGGGDHALSAGTIPAMSARAEREGSTLFVLWLDAHPDFHTLRSTTSGNLHGTPMAYLTGETGFEGGFPPCVAPVPHDQVLMMGLRSVDPAERQRLQDLKIDLCDMRRIDEQGIVRPLSEFLDRVKAANGRLHVSLDVDFLDPAIAPGCGTPVPGGLSEREGHLIMEMVHESGLLSSLDLVELNPIHDHAGRSARLLVDLTASAFGRTILDP